MRIYKIVKSTKIVQDPKTHQVSKSVLTSDEMISFMEHNSLRNSSGELDYYDIKHIANAVDKWELTDVPLSVFDWVADSSYKRVKSIGLPPPPIVLFDGVSYEVLDGKHRIGMAKDRGEETISVYLGKVVDDNNEKSLMSVSNGAYLLKTATRPIKLDRQKVLESINMLNKFLTDSYYYRIHENEPIGSKFVFIDRTVLKGVDGVEFDVQINYMGKDSPRTLTPIVGGVSGVTRDSNRPVVVVYINSGITPRMFSRASASSERIINNMIEVLEHELTHQADKFAKKFNSSGQYTTLPSADEIDLYSYYNNASEVRAYMRSIFDEIEIYLPIFYKKLTVRQVVRQVMERLNVYSRIWGRISKHLTDSNKRLILKGVSQAVEDWYGEHQNT